MQELVIYSMLVLVQFLNGGFHVLGSVAMRTMDPYCFALLRIGIATPVLFVVAYAKDRCIPPLKEHAMLCVLGLLGVMSNQVFFLLGLADTSPVLAASWQPSIPVFTAVIAISMKQEKIGSWMKPVGILLTTGACIAMILLQKNGGDITAGKNMIVGNLMLFANCLAMAFYMVLQKPMLNEKRVPPFTLTAWAFFYGLIGVLLWIGGDMVFFEEIDFIGSVTNQPLIVWIAVIYASFIASIAVYVMMVYGVKIVGALITTLFAPLQPVAAAILSLIFLRTVPTIPEYIGATGIIAGMLLVMYARSKELKVDAEIDIDSEEESQQVAEKRKLLINSDGDLEAVKSSYHACR